MTNTNITKLQSRVMRRVYLIFFAKSALKPFALKLYLTVFLLWGLLVNVSIFNVLKNMLAMEGFSFGNISYFYKYAFFNTELLTQISTLGILFVATFFTFSKAKNFYLNRSSY